MQREERAYEHSEKRSHHRGVILNLEYPENTPQDPMYAHVPHPEPNLQLYTKWTGFKRQSPHMHAAAFQVEMHPHNGRFHIQYYYADKRPRPTITEVRELLQVQPWQHRHFGPLARTSARMAWDFATQEDTRVPSTTPHTYGEAP